MNNFKNLIKNFVNNNTIKNVNNFYNFYVEKKLRNLKVGTSGKRNI